MKNIKYSIGNRVKIKCIDGSGYLEGTVSGWRFEKVLVSLDEYKTTDYEFDESKLEMIDKDSV